jgi:predicted RNase H-like nuclease
MIGVDGCKEGFMIVEIQDHRLRVKVEKSLESIKDYQGLILVDVPIGCPSSIEDSRPEPLLRKLVKERASSVFSVPALQTLSAQSYEEANKINRMILNKGLSKQSYHIIPIIKEVNEFMLKNPHLNIHESFPELIFTKLRGSPCAYSKHMKEGKQERIDCLIQNFKWLKEDLEKAMINFPQYYHLDIIDATSLACCAYLIFHQGAINIPKEFCQNSQGLDMKVTIFNS